MKKALLLSFVMIPALASAQAPQGFDPSKMLEHMRDPVAMQKMMEQAEATQKCMESIDRDALEELRKRAEAASKKIERLCTAGKKGEALATGIRLSREMNTNPTIQKMRECSKGMTDMMRDAPWARMTELPGMKQDSEPTNDDICS